MTSDSRCSSRGDEVFVFDSLEGLPPAVIQAFDAMERASPTAGLAWYTNFVREVHPGPGQVCRMFYARTVQGHVRAVLPLAVVPSRWPLHHDVNALANYYTPLYRPGLSADATADDVAALVRRVRADHGPLARFMLSPMDSTSDTFRLLEAGLRQAGFCTYHFFAFGNWFLPADGLNWETYLTTRRGKMRSDIKRMEKRLRQAGASIQIVSDTSDLDRAIADYQHVYARSWKQEEPHVGFVPGLMRLCAERGWLRLGLLHIDHQPIAAQLWIVANGRAEIFKVAYDEKFKDFSPGTVLSAQLMRHVLDEDKVREVDFLSGDDTYKRNWMSERRERFGIVAYDLRSIGGCAGMAVEALSRRVRPLCERLRRSAAKPNTASPASQH
jgi:CelD/BcsL family acetyltransferase involved in cellulose biosynthesis